MITLKKIELPIRKDDDRIKPHTFYLAKIDARTHDGNGKFAGGFIGWFAGTFTKQHYGWNFNSIYTAGFQYSYRGWAELYEIEDEEITEFYKKLEDRME